MKTWPDPKLLRLLGIDSPIVQAPMAGVDTPALAVAVSKAGGLGSLACALLSPAQIRDAWQAMRRQTDRPLNLNFFCHAVPARSAAQQLQWQQLLAPYYAEFGIDPATVAPSPARAPFDASFCEIVEELRPPVVSFHFGLPNRELLDRVRHTGAAVLSSATTVEEAIWLEQRGCDAVIAQGIEAGGHRGMFLETDIGKQLATMELVPRIVDAISIPVIAAGGIDAAQSARAVFAAGASAIQLGTAYLFCSETRVSPLYRSMLESDRETTLTNIFSGRPARGIVNRLTVELGPMSAAAPDFPHAAHWVNPLRQASEKSGSADFMQLWSGSRRKPHTLDAETFTRALCAHILAPG
jgi:nitronate monooxygenase